MKKILASLFFILFSVISIAQSSPQDEPPQMAGVMRENGKIYVVVAVVVTILIGLFIYLISVDRKVGRLEKEYKRKN
jgi:hypothetical protein